MINLVELGYIERKIWLLKLTDCEKKKVAFGLFLCGKHD